MILDCLSNSLSLWERARVRAKLTHTTLTSILSLQRRARKLFLRERVRVRVKTR